MLLRMDLSLRGKQLHNLTLNAIKENGFAQWVAKRDVVRIARLLIDRHTDC